MVQTLWMQAFLWASHVKLAKHLSQQKKFRKNLADNKEAHIMTFKCVFRF